MVLGLFPKVNFHYLLLIPSSSILIQFYVISTKKRKEFKHNKIHGERVTWAEPCTSKYFAHSVRVTPLHHICVYILLYIHFFSSHSPQQHSIKIKTKRPIERERELRIWTRVKEPRQQTHHREMSLKMRLRV